MKVLCNHCYVVANCLTYDFVSDCFGIYLLLVVVIGSGIFQVISSENVCRLDSVEPSQLP